MRSDRTCLRATWLLLVAAAAPGLADVFSSEFFFDPVSEGWELIQQICAETRVDDGWYYQRFDHDVCPLGSATGQDAYVRSITEFNGEPQFFLEFRVQTDGDRSEIPRGAPSGIAMGCFCGVIYHVTVARDLVKFIGHFDLPGWFIEIEPGVPHTYRIELYPDRYAFYIDAYLIDEGLPDGPFPAHDSRISWRGKSWYLPCENAWDYIRYGVIPVDGSGDYDSDAEVTLDDFYFVHECLTNQRPGVNGGPGNDAGPACRFADFDFDTDVDLLDFAAFQLTFTGGE
ncbi:MAG: hypothetical protein JSU86_08185 [Phycisphaerales bacterium]|nr:MAG: hypothetical protein JSU86_08185 [Phycisphaerales bacterium]